MTQRLIAACRIGRTMPAVHPPPCRFAPCRVGGNGISPTTYHICFCLPPALVHTTTVFFLEGLKRPVPGMIAMVVANRVNVLLDWLLVSAIGACRSLGTARSGSTKAS